MRYQIFLSDFDGTLVRADGTVSQKNKDAITRYRAAGGIFAVVTGRMPASILRRMSELGITEGLAAGYQGAAIADIATGEFLCCNTFEREDAVRALTAMESLAAHVHCYTPDRFYSNLRDEPLARYEKLCGVQGTVIEGEPLSAFAARERLRVTKVLCMIEPERCEALRAALQTSLGEKFYVTRSARFAVEILPAGQNKGCAAEFISQYYGVPLSKIAAIGDELNDLPMIARVGGKFAVANADERLKENARVVAACADDGVAEALEYASEEA